VRDDTDTLDLSYLEKEIDEPEYTDSRRTLMSQFRDSNLREPMSPSEAGRLFLEKNHKVRVAGSHCLCHLMVKLSQLRTLREEREPGFIRA